MESKLLNGRAVLDDACHARLSEAHNRIANNLALIAGFVRLQASALSRQSRLMSSLEARRLVEEIGVRIDTVGRLHRQLSANPAHARVDLGDHLRDTCDVLVQSLTLDSPTELTCEAHACEMDCERAGLVGLIVAELVTNSVKYAHPAGAPGRIDVRCRGVGDDALQITVADDGVGLPDGFDTASDGGLGFRVIRSLCSQLSAELSFESFGVGLTTILIVPTDRPDRVLDAALSASA